MKQGGFFPELDTPKKDITYISEKSFPEITLRNLLSDKFIEDNGMFGLRMLLKRAKKTKHLESYGRILEAEISMKHGENTLKNNLRHIVLWDTCLER